MKYNTQEKRMALPEYGRTIQTMVDHCLSIADREERKRCANTIISVMGNLFPHLRDVNDFKHILWDHLAIMADFQLDIDYPYEVIKKEDLYRRPARIPYMHTVTRYRHYGNLTERMIRKATEMEDPQEQEQISILIANYMKRSYLGWNKDSVDDRKIFDDLKELSHGTLSLDEEKVQLIDSRELVAMLRSNNIIGAHSKQKNLRARNKGR